MRLSHIAPELRRVRVLSAQAMRRQTSKSFGGSFEKRNGGAGLPEIKIIFVSYWAGGKMPPSEKNALGNLTNSIPPHGSGRPHVDLLRGFRVLIVEDVVVLAWLVEEMIRAFGCRTVGPAVTVEAALGLLADDAEIDAVLLDINLHEEMSFPVADALQEKNIPFAFATAYGREHLPERFASHPLLQKPYDPIALRVTLESMALSRPRM